LQAYQGGQVAAAIIHHLSRGGGDPLQIAHYAELAGTQAYSLSAYTEAEQYYVQAVRSITHGKLPLQDGASETALCQSIRSLADIPDPIHVARLLERVCECRVVQGNFEGARNLYKCILELRNHYQTSASETERKQEAQIQAL